MIANPSQVVPSPPPKGKASKTSAPKPNAANRIPKTKIGAKSVRKDPVLRAATKAIGMRGSELEAWLASYPNLSINTRTITLQLITQYRLDPKADEIDLVQYEAGQWQALITVNGWAKLINAQPAFCGIEFAESKEHDGAIPRWMSCTIYRTDRVKPITVKEYLVELKTEHPCWQVMPRRMLRHRAMQQCARLAFGITVPECKSPASALVKTQLDIKNPVPHAGIPSIVSHGTILKAHLLRETHKK
ncbi:hypothetical protein PHIN8_05990 [Polynucleobacter sp. HIN8]|uniref:recombinase RecT n=1 Tax=Polynucleobacter sp. HIN8 TaxID=3047867 RepID=UPI002572BA80|nr:recombinase RecT [Polynucleobacter sp. HIN8]BEI38655.1 hypothetical protein PHIN8_05990 [Polynucleobacter sp. HIN8]